MASKALIDTHVMVWLYEGRLQHFSKKVLQILERAQLLVCPINVLELDYLYECHKITKTSREILKDLIKKLDVQILSEPFNQIIDIAVDLNFSRDPFDRIMVAHAKLLQIPIISKDRLIKKHYAKCMW